MTPELPTRPITCPACGQTAGHTWDNSPTADETILAAHQALEGCTDDHYAETVYSCGRCGSSVEFEECGYCIACGYSEDDPDPNCPICDATGIVAFCVSSEEWCTANPLDPDHPGERHSVVETEILA